MKEKVVVSRNDYLLLKSLKFFLVGPFNFEHISTDEVAISFSRRMHIVNSILFVISLLSRILFMATYTQGNSGYDFNVNESVIWHSTVCIASTFIQLKERRRSLTIMKYLKCINEVSQNMTKYKGEKPKSSTSFHIVLGTVIIICTLYKFSGIYYRVLAKVIFVEQPALFGALIGLLMRIMSTQTLLVRLHHIVLVYKMIPVLCTLNELAKTIEVNEGEGPIFTLSEPMNYDYANIIDNWKSPLKVFTKNGIDRLHMVLKLHELVHKAVNIIDEESFEIVIPLFIADGLSAAFSIRSLAECTSKCNQLSQVFLVIFILYAGMWLTLPIECLQRIKNLGVAINYSLSHLLLRAYSHCQDTRVEILEELWVHTHFEQKDIKFTSSGFFEVDRSLLAGVVGVIGSYVVFVLQSSSKSI